MPVTAAGLILDIGHAGKPAPHERDRGAIHGQRVEVELTRAYTAAATAACLARGIRVEHIRPPPAGWSYDQRHRVAASIARASPSVRWLYVQAHVNSAETDARYGLVGFDARSSGGRAAAGSLAQALAAALVPKWLARARAEAVDSDGPWKRMFGTIDGIWEGPANLAGVCYEPAFIQSDLWSTPTAADVVGDALVDGVEQWRDLWSAA